jgi:hypothetical protein
MIAIVELAEKFDLNVAHKAFLATFIDYLACETPQHLGIFVRMFNDHRAVKKMPGRLMFVEGEA